MKLSQDGLAFIASWEGFRKNPYNDAAGHATLGFGHLLHYGPVTAGDHARWDNTSRSRALSILSQDAVTAGSTVNRLVRPPLSQAQFDALVSLVFNIGGGAFGKSTLLRVLNQGSYRETADQFLRWDKAGGKTLLGLTRRRQAERKMFLEGEKVKRWQQRLETIRDAADHPPGWTLSRRIRARILKALIASRT